MPIPMTAQEVLDREFFEMRAKILQLGASFDRMERAKGELNQEDRIELLNQGLHILLDQKANRAEQIQLLFSREYEENWKSTFNME